MKKIVSIALFLILMMNLIPVLNLLVNASPTCKFVSLTGSDSTGDGSCNNPYKTLRKALDALDASKKGNKIYIRGGTYTDLGTGTTQRIVINRNYTTISAYNNENVIFDLSGFTTSSAYPSIFFLYNGSRYYHDITFYGINISNITCDYGSGIQGYCSSASTACDNITISHCSFYNIRPSGTHGGRAIVFYGRTGNTCDNLNINNCTFNYIQSNTTMNECITLMGCRHFIFENNSIRNFVKQFLATSGGCCDGKVRFNSFENKWYYSIKLDPYNNCNNTICNIDYYNNMFYGNAPLIATNNPISFYINPEATADGGSIHHINIYNNIFNISTSTASIQCLGVNINLGLITTFTISHVTIKHNTFYTSGPSSKSYDLRITKSTGMISDSVISNNIFCTDGVSQKYQVSFSDLPQSQTSFTITNNQFYNFSGATNGIQFSDGSGYGTNGSWTNPQFVSISLRNFHLNKTSPCIDTTDSAYAVSTDYDGYPRLQNGSSDRGAYEYVLPRIRIEVPSEGEALQDGITFQSSVIDPSGVDWVTYSIREPGIPHGTIIDSAYESLPATFTSNDYWELEFDTTQLLDGYYVLYVNASDALGHDNHTSVNFSIRNWAVLEKLPNTPNSKAGRTIPVKFSLRVAAAVDPTQPFVRNEELTLIIYEKNHPTPILQVSTYGTHSTDYRIDSTEEQYITNFKTLKTPTTYVVEIWRIPLQIGSFEFQTTK